MFLHHSKESQWRWKDPHQFAEKYCRSTNRAHSAFAPLPPLLLLLLRLVAINCPTSAFTLFYNPRPAFLQIIYSLSLPAAILSVLKSLHRSVHCTWVAPLSPLGREMNTSEVEMMNLHNYLPPPQYVPPQGLLARTHEGWWWGVEH